MKSITLPSYNKNIIRAMLGLKVTEIETPKPGNNDVIIKVHAAPVNPSDIAFIQGNYNVVKTLPATPGFEASGKVIDAGKNTKSLIGKNVSCFVQDDRSGTWSEYVIAHIDDVILLKDEMELDQAACFTVNPFTAYGMFEIALMHESKAIIQNASGSQVALFVRKMAAENNIKVIDIVRKKESADKLINDGTEYVLIETDEDFENKLADLAKQLNATVAFDAVGGILSGMMYNAMPADSELVVYGGLSGKQITDIDVMEVIFNNKIISGFNLMDWKAELEDGEFESISEKLQDKFIAGDYKTNIRESFSLDNIVKGLRSYISDMSSGKILIKP
ncbi:MAG: zinc-binding dehydrogenase [Bacteroidota bacterium]